MPDPIRENKFNFLSGSEIFSGITLAAFLGATYSLPEYSRVTVNEFGARLRLKEKKKAIVIHGDKRKLKDPEKRMTLVTFRNMLTAESANKSIMFGTSILQEIELGDDRVRLKF